MNLQISLNAGEILGKQETERVKCPHPSCSKEFQVLRYGWKIPCPHCGRRVDIFPEPKIFLHTKMGVIGVGFNV